MYDAIVVGARCAGSPTAMLLARRGHRVLLVDRATFPSDTISTHFVHHTAVARLARWGLLDRVLATGCPPVGGGFFDFGDFVLEGAPPAADGFADAYCVRRTRLDKILVDAARESGAEVREAFSVERLVFEEGRVVGIRGRSRGGPPVTEYAPIVVGADGRNSRVAAAVGAREYDAWPARTFAYYSYWSGVPCAGFEFYPRRGRGLFAFPTNDGLTCLIALGASADFRACRSDIAGFFDETLALAPSLAARVRGGRREEPFRGTPDLRNFRREAHGPGWALVGDAGFHKDPITGQGIKDAFFDAESLAAAIDDGLSRRRALEESLADYARRRDERTRGIYELTVELAALEPPTPEMDALHRALAGDPEEAGRFFGTITGATPVEEFFAPANVARILAKAASRAERVA